MSSRDLWLSAGLFHEFKGSAYIRICVAYYIREMVCIKGGDPLHFCDTKFSKHFMGIFLLSKSR